MEEQLNSGGGGGGGGGWGGGGGLLCIFSNEWKQHSWERTSQRRDFSGLIYRLLFLWQRKMAASQKEQKTKWPPSFHLATFRVFVVVVVAAAVGICGQPEMLFFFYSALFFLTICLLFLLLLLLLVGLLESHRLNCFHLVVVLKSPTAFTFPLSLFIINWQWQWNVTRLDDWFIQFPSQLAQC